MSILDWTLTTALFILYICCLITVCTLTFKKGYVLLGVIGIFFPILWLIGAILPAKRGSQYQIQEQARYQTQFEQMTR